MTDKEVKEAFLAAAPVIYKGREYRPIQALIYRRKGKQMLVQAEIADTEQCNAVYIVAPQELTAAEVAEDAKQEQSP